jgi:hypothetical protein
MTDWNKIKEVVTFLFPDGNYRYYIMYLSSLFVSGFFVIIFIVTINYMNYGETIDTGTFVAQQMFRSYGFLKEPTVSIIGWLLGVFSYVWLAFAVHTVVSIFADMRELIEGRL